MRLDQPAARREAQRERPEDPGRDAAEQSVADLLEHEVRGRVSRGRAGVGLGDGDRDEEDRDAEPVIEAALDVEALPDTGRDALIGDDRLAERGIRAREHHREHRRLRDADPGDHERAHEGARDDRQREADAQQPQRHGELPTQRAQRDPRGIREEHERQRDLGQELDLLALEPEVEQPEHRPGEQPGRREEHRARHAQQLQPSRERCVGDQQDRDRRERPGHGAVCSGSVAGPAYWRAIATRSRSSGATRWSASFVLAEIDLHPVDRAGKDAALTLVRRSGIGRTSRGTSSDERLIGLSSSAWVDSSDPAHAAVGKARVPARLLCLYSPALHQKEAVASAPLPSVAPDGRLGRGGPGTASERRDKDDGHKS